MQNFRLKFYIFLISGLISIILTQCKSKKSYQDQKEEEVIPREQIYVPDFNKDSAYHFVEKQVSFGPRVPNTTAHRKCGDYLINKFKEYKAGVQVQSFEAEAFDGTQLNLRNIIASYNPDKRKRILLAAHWDTRPFADKDDENKNEPIPGANDGASGVGVLLEIARTFAHDSMPEVGVDIILFDGEDYGQPQNYKATGNNVSRSGSWWCLGSQYWAENLHEQSYSAYYGILLDMVGAKNATFYREGLSMRNAPSVVKKIWDLGHELGYGQYFVYDDSPQIEDDHRYVNQEANIPMINIVDYDANSNRFFKPYHHTHEDNMDIISKATLEAVGETVIHAVYYE